MLGAAPWAAHQQRIVRASGGTAEGGELLTSRVGEERDFKAINTPKIYHQVDKLSE